MIQWDKHIARVPSYGAEAMAIQAPAYSSSLSIFLSLSLTCSFFPSHFALFPEYLLFLHSPAQGERVTLDSCDSYSIYLVNNPFSLNFLTFLFRPPPTPTTRIPVAFTDSRVSRAPHDLVLSASVSRKRFSSQSDFQLISLYSILKHDAISEPHRWIWIGWDLTSSPHFLMRVELCPPNTDVQGLSPGTCDYIWKWSFIETIK